MSVKVHIRPIVSKHADNSIVAEVDGDTVGQCFNDLVKQFPGIEKDLFDGDGKLLSYINIYLVFYY